MNVAVISSCVLNHIKVAAVDEDVKNENPRPLDIVEVAA